MMSAVGGGGGSPKSRQKEQHQLICDSDRGEGVKKSENFADAIYGSLLPREGRGLQYMTSTQFREF